MTIFERGGDVSKTDLLPIVSCACHIATAIVPSGHDEGEQDLPQSPRINLEGR